MSSNKFIEKEIVIKASKEILWSAWTTADKVQEWFAPKAIIENRVGGAYELYFVPNNINIMNTKGCKITKMDLEKELNFNWKAPDQFKYIMNNDSNLTSVIVILEESNSNITKLKVKHIGFGTEDNWKDAYEWHEKAWTEVLSSYKHYIETETGNLCCN